MAYWIYIHVNKVNGKIYVGQTARDPQKRWGHNGKDYHAKNLVFGNAVEKYGWDNFDHIVEECPSREVMNMTEEFLIKTLRSQDKRYGYNVQKGGYDGNRGRKLSNTTRHNMSVSHIGKLKGIPKSEEHVRKMAEAKRKAFQDPSYREKACKRMTEVQSDPEVRKKMSLASKEKWKNVEYREHMSQVHKGQISGRRKEVNVYLKDGTFIGTYPHMKVVCDTFNISEVTARRMLVHKSEGNNNQYRLIYANEDHSCKE